MMTEYKLYMISSSKIKAGKFVEATKWWAEKGLPDLRSRPWAKSVQSYAAQFGLGGEYDIETWTEIEDYSAMDAMDNWIIEDQERAEKIRKMWEEANDYFEWGPTRLMGDWPESSLLPD
jgi:hypothetical protein